MAAQPFGTTKGSVSAVQQLEELDAKIAKVKLDLEKMSIVLQNHYRAL